MADECGILSDSGKCFKGGAMWAWRMEWHTNYIRNVDTGCLKKLYSHDLIITSGYYGSVWQKIME